MTLVAICESPIFIIGAPRSGTSILGWSLAQHDGLAVGHESDMLFELTHPQKLEDVYRKVTGRPDSLEWLRQNGVDEDEFLASIGLGLNALMTSRNAERRWIEQTPANTLVAWTLVRLFPGARFIHILAQVLAVIRRRVCGLRLFLGVRIVVPKLDEEVIAFLHHAQDLVEPLLALEGIERQAGLRVI